MNLREKEEEIIRRTQAGGEATKNIWTTKVDSWYNLSSNTIVSMSKQTEMKIQEENI